MECQLSTVAWITTHLVWLHISVLRLVMSDTLLVFDGEIILMLPSFVISVLRITVVCLESNLLYLKNVHTTDIAPLLGTNSSSVLALVLLSVLLALFVYTMNTIHVYLPVSWYAAICQNPIIFNNIPVYCEYYITHPGLQNWFNTENKAKM